METPAVEKFRTWFIQNGGLFHSQVRLAVVPSGLSVIAATDIPSSSRIVACPVTLIISAGIVRTKLTPVFGSDVENWSDRQVLASYLALHSVLDDEDARRKCQLFHAPYVAILPPPHLLRTGVNFTSQECDICFKGTNLYGAIIDRKQLLRTEWDHCIASISRVNPSWAEKFTWELFLAHASHISSRAFPSSLLSRNPSLISTPETGLILIPGVDSLNHARANPVSWSIDFPHCSECEDADIDQASISLVLHKATAANKELFNNYGAKPNSELILGYGFTLPDNPEDSILLRIGGGLSTKAWEIGRDAHGIEGLWIELLSMITGTSEEGTYEDQLDVSATLADMTDMLLGKLPLILEAPPSDIREDVFRMHCDYVQGQKDIISSVLAFAKKKEQEAVKEAQEKGINIVFED